MEDVHEEVDNRGIPISVGVEDVRHRVLVLGRDGDLRECFASVDVLVSLDHDVRGIHMSRILRWLGDWNPLPVYGGLTLDASTKLRQVMRGADMSVTSHFAYPVVRKTPKEHLRTTQFCDAVIQQRWYGRPSSLEYKASLTVPVFTVCPCSLSMCDGHAAHTQRCYVTATITQNWEHLWERCIPLEDIYDGLSLCGSAPVYSTLKRPDEMSVVQEGFDNPKFVEDVVRDAVIELRSRLKFSRLEIQAHSQESIHPHCVVARAEVSDEDKAET